MGETVGIVDTTLRDGQMSLWATNLRTAHILPVLEAFAQAGFDAMEIIGSSFFKKCVRDLQDNPWERLDRVRERVPIPLRAIKTRHMAAFQITPWALSELWLQRLAAHGVRQVRISDPSNTVAELAHQVAMARAAGLEPIVNLIFSVSPKHTDAYYAERARALRTVPAARLCLKDPGGLLTPERTASLVRVLLMEAGDRPVEIHGHCTNGLGELNALAAVEAGVRLVNTAVAPLADGASLPDGERTVAHLRALGYTVPVDDAALERIRTHFSRLRLSQGWPEGRPGAADPTHLAHQIPGGMISNFRAQLAQAGMSHRLPEVLEEVARVRAELGYPIMVTPYSQFVGSQAAINVLVGERYREVTDEIIRYALGQWGVEEAAGIDPAVRDRILDRRRARELAQAAAAADWSVETVRRQLDLPADVDPDTLLLHYLAGADAVARLTTAPPPAVVAQPVAALLQAIMGSGWRTVEVRRDGWRLAVRRAAG